MNTRYYHTDLIGTTRRMSTATTGTAEAQVYTAFGEKVNVPTGTGFPGRRYGFAGASGYQSATTSVATGDAYGSSFPYLHVGARYYDPSSGRFLQRDSIGIKGALNVYEYVRNMPTAASDPSGLLFSSVHVAVATGTISAAEALELLGITVAVVTVGHVVGSTCGAIIQSRIGELPMSGPPNGSSVRDNGDGKGQIRDYGPNGRPLRDIDFGHDHPPGRPGDPHIHDWDWARPVCPRLPGRPVGPGDAVHPPRGGPAG
jgi:RHS repeat-associated protein